jgi:hypothetical protein
MAYQAAASRKKSLHTLTNFVRVADGLRYKTIKDKWNIADKFTWLQKNDHVQFCTRLLFANRVLYVGPLVFVLFLCVMFLPWCLLAVLAAQLGTPRGRCDEHNDKFPSIMKPRFNRPVGGKNHFWRLMLAGFWQGALPASTAMWNLHTTQPKYFAPTCSEIFNLTGLM